MYLDSVNGMAEAACAKVAFLERSKLSYLTSAALAGAYIGFGIILIFSVGGSMAAKSSPMLKLLMGMSFGIALTLVVFAGAELFTGNNMIMTLGGLRKSVSWSKVLKVWCYSWVGNLIGSLVLACIVVNSGAVKGAADFIESVAAAKMSLPVMQLFLRAILCNWLVCLALWTTSRTKNDAAKCILIFWCLLAFIASGFEHSIANMTLLGMSLFAPHAEAVSWGGFAYNMLWVTLGNIIGGAGFVGGLYWLATFREKE
jgi:nitrite transporter NirC